MKFQFQYPQRKFYIYWNKPLVKYSLWLPLRHNSSYVLEPNTSRDLAMLTGTQQECSYIISSILIFWKAYITDILFVPPLFTTALHL